MEIFYKNGYAYLKGKFNPEEKLYLVDYFVSLGSDVKIIKPDSLKIAYKKKLKSILNMCHFRQ